MINEVQKNGMRATVAFYAFLPIFLSIVFINSFLFPLFMACFAWGVGFLLIAEAFHNFLCGERSG